MVYGGRSLTGSENLIPWEVVAIRIELLSSLETRPTLLNGAELLLVLRVERNLGDVALDE